MKSCKRLFLIPILLLILLLGGCSQSSRYTSNVDNDSFSLTFYPLNGTRAESFALNTGDLIEVSAAKESGQLGIIIARTGEKPVYQSDALKVSACDFTVEVPEDGTYTITVTGRKAYGSAEFTIDRKGTTEHP